MMTSTIGTTIWGSSSRGVNTTATMPSRIEATTRSGVSLLARKVRASLPARPSGGPDRVSTSMGYLDRLAVGGRRWIFDHHLAGLQAPASPDALPPRFPA